MGSAFETGILLMESEDFAQASELFAKSFRDGYMRRDSLLNYSNCKLMQATLKFSGTGFFSGMPRRSLLISASSALRDGLREFGEDTQYLYLACCVEYALGLLVNKNDGRTHKFNEYLKRLDDADYETVGILYDYMSILRKKYS